MIKIIALVVASLFSGVLLAQSDLQSAPKLPEHEQAVKKETNPEIPAGASEQFKKAAEKVELKNQPAQKPKESQEVKQIDQPSTSKKQTTSSEVPESASEEFKKAVEQVNLKKAQKQSQPIVPAGATNNSNQ
jgi:hypothetical protein